MLINASAAEEVRMAVVEDGVLTDLDVETASKEKSRGNIYKGIVANVEASLGAAFIEFGHAKQGFLAFDDLRQELWDPSWQGEGRPRITDVLHRKQEIVVQVIKEEMGSKGAAVTSFLSLPGRSVVLMHSGGGRGGVSRKIDDERERAKAKELLDKLKVPDDLGVIIRTAGMGKSRAELQKDLNNLSRQWSKIMETAEIARAPSLLYREPDLVVRTIRDYLTPDVDEVWVDDPEEYEEALDYFSAGEEEGAEEVPGERAGKDLIKLYEGSVPLFEKHNVEDQIEALYKRNVPLPSGGYLVIDQTEALVSIDVNSGKSNREDDHESTVYKTNMEAVGELARQLRLRDMGGIVVVDLIDMASRKHERDVENRLRDVIKSDKARIKLGRISENGLLELTRQRLRQAHRLVSHVPCGACSGTGVVRAIPGQAVAALRELQTRCAAGAGQLSKLVVHLPLDVANHLSNHKRLELDALARQWEVKLEVLADPTVPPGESRFEEERRGKAALAAPGLASVKDKDEEWRHRRRGRREEKEEDPAKSQQPQTIEDRQEQQFESDRGKQRSPGPRGKWDRSGGRPHRGEQHRAPEVRSAEKQAQTAQDDAAGRPQLVAEDIRGAPPRKKAVVDTGPRHYPDDPVMQALYGDPPPLEQDAGAPPRARVAASQPDASAPAAALEGAAAAPLEGEEQHLNGTAVHSGPGATAAGPALGEDGQQRKRRRRRRRKKRGPMVLDPLTGQLVPQQGVLPGAAGMAGALQSADGAEDDGEDEEEDEGLEAASPVPKRAASMPPRGAGHLEHNVELAQAATHVILGTQPHAPPPGPPPNALEGSMVAVHFAAEDYVDEDLPLADPSDAVDWDDEEEGDALEAALEDLGPLPPAGPSNGNGVAAAHEPTVLAKRTPRRPGTGKPRGALPRTKKKAAAKKKAKPRS